MGAIIRVQLDPDLNVYSQLSGDGLAIRVRPGSIGDVVEIPKNSFSLPSGENMRE